MNFKEIFQSLRDKHGTFDAAVATGFLIDFLELEKKMSANKSLYNGIEFPESISLDKIRLNLYTFEPQHCATSINILMNAGYLSVYDDSLLSIFVKSTKKLQEYEAQQI